MRRARTKGASCGARSESAGKQHWDSSSNGRAGDSKSLGWGFESSLSRFFVGARQIDCVSFISPSFRCGDEPQGAEREAVFCRYSGIWKVRAVRRLFGFVRESRAELKKVEWPAKQEVINSTIVVLISLLIVSLGLGGMDFVLTLFIRLFVGT